MSYTETCSATTESAVGNQEHILAKSGTLDGSSDHQHLAHARAALRPLVADHHDVAGADLAVEERLQCAFLAVVDPGAPGELQAFLAGDLRHRAAQMNLPRARLVQPENRPAQLRPPRPDQPRDEPDAAAAHGSGAGRGTVRQEPVRPRPC